MQINFQQNQGLSQAQKLKMGITFANIITMSSGDLEKKMKELEGSEIFKKLSLSAKERIIEILPIKKYYSPYKFLNIDGKSHDPNGHSSTVEANRDETILISDEIEFIIEDMKKPEYQDLLTKINNIGQDRFIYYFIDGKGTDTELSHLLNISIDQVKFLHKIINKAQLIDEFCNHNENSTPYLEQEKPEIIAEVYISEKTPHFNFSFERARYRINDDKLSNLYDMGKISNEEIREFNAIKDSMILINRRLNFLHDIVTTAVESQINYLCSFDLKDLRVLKEKDVAGLLNIDESWLCRLLGNKSVKKYLLINDKPVTLRSLFITEEQLNKRLGRHLVKSICNGMARNGRNNPLTDIEIQRILKEKHRFSASRRTINNWRREGALNL